MFSGRYLNRKIAARFVKCYGEKTMRVVSNKYRGTKEYALAYSALVIAAHSRTMYTYAGISHLTGLPPIGAAMAREVGHLVGEISEDEVKCKRPMLSALVVEKDTGLAGRGFFRLALPTQVTHGNLEKR
jgi:hypothetical protein